MGNLIIVSKKSSELINESDDCNAPFLQYIEQSLGIHEIVAQMVALAENYVIET